MNSNPLLDTQSLPTFSAIRTEHIEPVVRSVIAANEARLAQLLADPQVAAAPTWDTLMAPLEELEDAVNTTWSAVGHLFNVCNTKALRNVYDRCQALVTDHLTQLAQNETLYQRVQALQARADELDLSRARRKVLADAVLDFELAGVHLDGERKARFQSLERSLNALSNQFTNHVLDSTRAWSRHFDTATQLAGLPDSALQAAATAAKRRGLDGGYLITLDMPSYLAVMTYADDRTLRSDVYRAYNTRASDQDPLFAPFDNSAIIEQILRDRREMAALLGYDHYASLSLAKKMAGSPQEVLDFLNRLVARGMPQAQAEMAELRLFATREGVTDLQPWDVPYFSEKLRHRAYDLSQETLRQYFPLDRVRQGMFSIMGHLFGVTIESNTSYDTWHPNVEAYDIYREGSLIARFFLDPFPREGKRGGAWMDICRNRRLLSDGRRLPAAYLVCNFSEPTESLPALLTHREVTTLFHEFGHGLHLLLTEVDELRISGLNGVAWDAVELPSQLLENWCWSAETLPMISGHHVTGEPLPDDLLQRMLAARNFQAGLMMMRQLEFALFDFELHCRYDALMIDHVRAILASVRERTAVLPVPGYHRFENGFSHIFAGGYAAGYYSYYWAEVLSADVFSRFEAEGILNPETGKRFLSTVLSRGGSEEAAALFRNFMGRDPSIDALLRQRGLLAA